MARATTTTNTAAPQEMQDTWDVIVLGGGPAGENAADYAIRGSNRTAVIVEPELVGGECSYWACMPSKALLRSVQVAELAQTLPGLAGRMSKRGIDVKAVLERRDSFTSHLDDAGQVKWATGAGIDVVRGCGRLSGPRAVEVVDAEGAPRTLHARLAVVLATGTTAAVPPVPGLAEALPWTSRDVTNVHQIPRRVAVIGGGVVACEATTWLHGLGVEELTLLERSSGLLGRTEPFAGEMVEKSLRDKGVRVITDASIEKVSRRSPKDNGIGHIAGGPVTVHLGGRKKVVVDEIVVATGRAPSSIDLGFETVGLADAVAANHGYVKVDDHLQVEGVSGQWLYAVGDINGRALLTHMGKYQGRIVGAVIGARAEGKRLSGKEFQDRASVTAVPSVTFTSPEVCSVGLTESAARDAGVEVETVEIPLGVSGAWLLRDDYVGRAKLVIDHASDTLVGATFVGEGTGELIHSATVAIVGNVTLADLWHAVPSYPTVSEIWLRLLEARRFG